MQCETGCVANARYVRVFLVALLSSCTFRSLKLCVCVGGMCAGGLFKEDKANDSLISILYPDKGSFQHS